MLLLSRRLLLRQAFSPASTRFLSKPKVFSTFHKRRMEPVTSARDTNVNAVVFDAGNMSPLSEVPDDIEEAKPKPKRPSRKRKAAVVVKVDAIPAGENDTTGRLEEQPTQARRKRKVIKDSIIENKDDDDLDAKPVKRKRKTASKIAASEEGEEYEEKPKKSRRRKTPEEEKVFDMPPIENILSTSFKGRLGYACLNSMLRRYSTPIFCSRTCRLSTIADLGAQHVRSLGLQNIRDLHTLVNWNVQNGIFFMRMSSEMFPFASHPEHGYTLEFADAELKAAGKTARELGVRLTSHPGQFTQLGSPREVVVRNAVRDLEYHCEMMDRMELDQDSVMIIHMGGTFNDKAATLERFKEHYTKLLPERVKRRLVLENDELCYNVDDLLPICQDLHIPLIFDYHHDWIYPSSRPPRELIPEINKLWYDKGIKPKQHYSEPRPGAVSVMERRAHSDRVKVLPEGLPDDMDLMLECKDKEQAVFYLYRLYGLKEVDPRMLRPPAAVESLHTNGRKSTKRARAKAAAATVAAMENEDDDGDGEEGEAKFTKAHDDAEDDLKEDVNAELERQAEEHGLPADDAGATLAQTAATGELDCGSGDEEPAVEVSVKKAGGRNKPRERKDAKRSGKGRQNRGRVTLDEMDA